MVFLRGEKMQALDRSESSSLKNVDLRTVEPETLVDIRNVKINPDLTKDERVMDYINQIKNPYCYKCGKIIVKISFSDVQATLEERLQNLLNSL
jgi:hypothetical protein